MSPDPVQVLGFVGAWCVLAAVLVGAWVAWVEFYAWCARRRAARAAVPLVLGAEWWAPEWEADWPET